MKTIALFGGSFDPIHIGHMTIAQQMAYRDDIDDVWMMLSPRNPLKHEEKQTTDDERLQMLQQAVKNESKIHICDIELSLPQPNYTYDTLNALQKQYPDYRFALIIGEDNLAVFHLWRNWKEILSQHNLYVYPRQNSESTLQHPHIHWIEAPHVNISSTEIRDKVKHGESIKGLVPDAITEIVENLYK